MNGISRFGRTAGNGLLLCACLFSLAWPRPALSSRLREDRNHSEITEPWKGTRDLSVSGETQDAGPADGGKSERKFAIGRAKVQQVAHLAMSHAGVVIRPFTSVGRLILFGLDTGIGIIDQNLPGVLPDGDPPPLSNRAGMDLEAWEADLDELTGTVSSSGSVRYLVDGGEFFPRLAESIAEAKESIDLRTYIFDSDDFAWEFGETLKKRSGEVDVRILLDGLGTILATMTDPKDLPPGFRAPASVKGFLKDGSRVRVRQQTNPWLTGDHVKATIIDGEVAFLGGMNIGHEYRYDWHDMMVQVRGPVVGLLNDEFDGTWAHAGILGDFGKLGHILRPGGRSRSGEGGKEPSLRILRTRPGDPDIFLAQKEAIRRASRRIYIQTPYFSDDDMLYELVRARHRGVDVRVILPEAGNHGVMHESNVLAANVMQDNGVQVYLYPGMSHVKAAVFDGWACFGSANFDKLSFRVNYEMDIASSHVDVVEGLIKNLFNPDFENSRKLTKPFPTNWHLYLSEMVADQL